MMCFKRFNSVSLNSLLVEKHLQKLVPEIFVLLINLTKEFIILTQDYAKQQDNFKLKNLSAED